MNRESIELRIDELNIRKKVLIKKALDLKRQIHKVDGRIEEMWEWLDSWKEKGEYGVRTLEGGVKVLKVPTFKTQAELQRALSGEPQAIGGASEKETLQARESRARFDAQQAVDVLSGQSPYDGDCFCPTDECAFEEDDADTGQANAG